MGEKYMLHRWFVIPRHTDNRDLWLAMWCSLQRGESSAAKAWRNFKTSRTAKTRKEFVARKFLVTFEECDARP